MTRRERRAPRRRSATESLLSIVLVLEALLVFFLTLVVFSLDILAPAVAFSVGGGLFLTMFAVGRLLRHPWALWFGWFLQALLIAAGFLVPLMFVIGAGFAALWTYCFITGRGLDRRNAALYADDTPIDPSSTDPSSTDTKETP